MRNSKLILTKTSFKISIFAVKIDIEEGGLKAGDIIEWRGRIATRRAPSSLYIQAGSNYTVMQMQIQGHRNRVSW